MKKSLQFLCLLAAVLVLLTTAVLAADLSVTAADPNVTAAVLPNNGDLQVTLTAADHYYFAADAELSVLENGTALEATDYTVIRSSDTTTWTVLIKNRTEGTFVVSLAPTPETYQITLKVGGGTDSHTQPPTYTYGTASVIINDPTPPTGALFLGWTVSAQDQTTNWTDGSTLTENPSQDYLTLNTAKKYGNVTLTAQYGNSTGVLSYALSNELTATVKNNVVTLSVTKKEEDDYELPLYVTVYQTKNGVSSILVNGVGYVYDRDAGTVTVNKDLLAAANITVYAEADPIRDILVEVEASNVILTGGTAWAQTKRDYRLEFEAAEGATLPAYVTVELVTASDDSRAVEYTYSSKRGTITIAKADLAELFEAEDLDERGFANGKYYLLISFAAKTEGKVELTTKKGRTTLTNKKQMTLDEALDCIDTDITNSQADSAVIELLGDCTTSRLIVVPEDFDLQFTAEDNYILTSTYNSKKRSYAIRLDKNAQDLTLDLAALCYAADVAVYDQVEEDITETAYPALMTITGETLTSTYLLGEHGFDLAGALALAEGAAKTCGDSVDLTILAGTKQTDRNTLSLPADVAVTLQAKAELTLKKTLRLEGQSLNVAGTLTLKDTSGKGSLVLTDASAKIVSETDLGDLVKTTVPGMEVVVQSADGRYTYTPATPSLPEQEEEPEKKEEEEEEKETTQAASITVTCGLGGTAAPASFTLAQGETKTIVITVNTGYTLDSILCNGKAVSSDRLLTTTTGYLLTWDTAEDSQLTISFIKAPSFSDVTTEAWFYEHVTYATAHELMVGFPDSKFHPYETMNVAQYLTVMYRYLADQLPNEIPVKETTGTNWTAGADYVNKTFLTTPYQNITNTELTRYAVADITYQVLKYLERSLQKSYSSRSALSFTDVPATDPYFTAVTYLSTVNILDGYSTGGVSTYQGSNPMVRSEIAKVLHYLMLVG